MSILKRLIIKVSGNRIAQKLLERNVVTSQYLMGIASGSETNTSGERAIFRYLRKTRQPPYCIFDVGSNIGQYLRLILNNIAIDDLSIHCFEPANETFKILAESCRKDERIKLNRIGLGRQKGDVALHYEQHGSGLASMTKRKLDHFGIDLNRSEVVTIDTIDSYCSEHGIDRIHLLKIDIEGHELDALSGAAMMFSNRSIDMVAFEFGGCNIDTRTFFQDFWYFFQEANFQVFRITPSGYLSPLDSYKEIDEQFRTTNFLAVAND